VITGIYDAGDDDDAARMLNQDSAVAPSGEDFEPGMTASAW